MAWEKLLTSANPYNRQHAGQVLRILKGNQSIDSKNDENKEDFSLSVVQKSSERIHILLEICKKKFTFLFSEDSKDLQIEQVLQENSPICSDIKFKDLSLLLLDQLYILRDRWFKNLSQEELRCVFLNNTAIHPFAHGMSLTPKDSESIFALKRLYDALIRFKEDQKPVDVIRCPMFKADVDLVEEAAKPQKIVIGIPAYRGHYDVSDRLINIIDEIRRFPMEWMHWQIEIIVCVNDDIDKIDDSADRIVANVPADLLYRVPLPVIVNICKEPRPRLLNLYQFLWIFFMQLCCTDQAGFGA